MASAGCCKKRSSRCIAAGSLAFFSSPLSLTSAFTTASITSVNGSRITTFTKRKRVLTNAMETLVIGISIKSNRNTAFAR